VASLKYRAPGRHRFFLFDLAEQVVQQRGRAETVASVVEPVVAERFLDGDEKRERLFRRANAARGFHRDGDAGIEVVVADRLNHHLVVAERRIGGGLARARLDEIAGADDTHGEKGGGADVVVGLKLPLSRG
jgi:hypothetical protein